jgi:hypothetical protein
MIHHETHTCTHEHGPRPAGQPDRCYYCRVSVGESHAHGCVMRRRSVVLRTTIEYVVMIPEDWTPEQVRVHRNETSWCANNLLDDMSRIRDSACLCDFTYTSFVREATAADEDPWELEADRTPASARPSHVSLPCVVSQHSDCRWVIGSVICNCPCHTISKGAQNGVAP